jgi:putative colanic acid biosynthesis acetyltransferase WcaF
MGDNLKQNARRLRSCVSISRKSYGPYFSLINRLKRVVWNITWTLFASCTPAPFHRWRVMLVRWFGGNVAWSAHIYPSVRIWNPSNLIMEENATLGPRVDCYCMALITIRKRATISQHTYLCGGTHDIDQPSLPLVIAPIEIGADAWVAAQAFVGPGVVIGEGAVLGARSVTFKDLDPYTVYVGIPAKPIKRRPRRKR